MRFLVLVLASAAVVALGACNRNENGGPGEKAGRAVDRAMDKAGKSVEQAGRDMQDASKGKK
ncbi:MAG TPA: hypothetical protein VE085_16670 [Burkholderiales bacterium]|nr:hypothetical protein [Burkholderiales bacterium]